MSERPPIYCFGPYEFDPRAGELRKFNHRIRLQGNSVKILEALLQTPTEVVTREELQQKIWPAYKSQYGALWDEIEGFKV